MALSTLLQIGLLAVLLWSGLVHHWRHQQAPACEMSYMYPSYEQIQDPGLAPPAAYGRYRLYLYQDYGVGEPAEGQ